MIGPNLLHPFLEDERWLESFWKVLVLYLDPIGLDHGLEKFARITQYEDGTKTDYTVYPVELLRRIVKDPELPEDLDIGYAILLDKDHLPTG